MRVPPILLSTSSCYPSSTESCFADAARLGYDGVEVMVWKWPETRDARRLSELAETYGVPVMSIHSPTLLLTQRVWGTDPWGKIDRSVELAEAVGAEAVVVHPPFRWQRDYAAGFVEGIARRQAATEVKLAVENMFPWKARAKDGSRTKERHAYLPHWDPVGLGYEHVTLDLSHAGVAGQDSLEVARRLGGRLAHLHLTDSTGSNRDEHLAPGRGSQPCEEVLRALPELGFTGSIAVEVTTRKMKPDEREAALVESLAFAREHLPSLA
ncbi:sugar phosphate isomerase/epimerase [Georgenia satyanarayanai]|uniref:sugar phosphate isomerase/epimerase family protein n=1 Tax=Georgenia satyanarayanai TaxID=860221 RepID=UPI00203DA6B1|nr:sugar phosphate isomerase/epimerase [Georgenia satyanarayanai]MCM3660670.1 sugar phosphate isomerase/epimerase [Georgenia satyanarayanai]